MFQRHGTSSDPKRDNGDPQKERARGIVGGTSCGSSRHICSSFDIRKNLVL